MPSLPEKWIQSRNELEPKSMSWMPSFRSRIGTAKVKVVVVMRVPEVIDAVRPLRVPPMVSTLPPLLDDSTAESMRGNWTLVEPLLAVVEAMPLATIPTVKPRVAPRGLAAV